MEGNLDDFLSGMATPTDAAIASAAGAGPEGEGVAASAVEEKPAASAAGPEGVTTPASQVEPGQAAEANPQGESPPQPLAGSRQPAIATPPLKSPEAIQLEQMAAMRGVTPAQLLQELTLAAEQNQVVERQRMTQQLAAQLYGELATKYGASADEAVIQELATLKATQTVNERYAAMERDRQARETALRQERERAEAARLEPWNRFFQRYPNADVKALPNQFYASLNQGMTPIEAMQEVELAELRAKSGKDAKREENNNKAVGSLTGSAGQEPPDDFLAGLLS